MKPLAYLMRPKSFDDIVGQDNLVGPNGVIRKMVDNNHLFSFILYGNPDRHRKQGQESVITLKARLTFHVAEGVDMHHQ